MNNVVTNIEIDFKFNPYIIISALILGFILYFRIVAGIDLTDEMQYYGQIKGLIETGQLFSNDLFIQQTVYLLSYPLFQLHHYFFAYSGFVFFGRLLLATIIFCLFVYSYKKLQRLNFSTITASLVALALTFSIPLYNIFALSYNTISQAIWVVFAIWFLEWKTQRSTSWVILWFLMGLAHPSSAIALAALVILRLLVEHRVRDAFKLSLLSVCGLLVLAPILVCFSTPELYLESLKFSSGFGAGANFFNSRTSIVLMVLIYFMFAFSLTIFKLLPKHTIPIITCAGLSLTLVYFAIFDQGWHSYALQIIVLSTLCALSSAWAVCFSNPNDKKLHGQIKWLTFSTVVVMTTLVITSSNGISQGRAPLMIFLPLLIGAAISNSAWDNSKFSSIFTGNINLVFLTLVYIVFWNNFPYRDSAWWQQNQPIETVQEFRFIKTTPEKLEFITKSQEAFKQLDVEKPTLIASYYPGLYFILNSKIDTCMLYMHSLTSAASEQALLACLNKKNPSVVIDLLPVEGGEHLALLKRAIAGHYRAAGLSCTGSRLELSPRTVFTPQILPYTLCL